VRGRRKEKVIIVIEMTASEGEKKLKGDHN